MKEKPIFYRIIVSLPLVDGFYGFTEEEFNKSWYSREEDFTIIIKKKIRKEIKERLGREIKEGDKVEIYLVVYPKEKE